MPMPTSTCSLVTRISCLTAPDDCRACGFPNRRGSRWPLSSPSAQASALQRPLPPAQSSRTVYAGPPAKVITERHIVFGAIGPVLSVGMLSQKASSCEAGRADDTGLATNAWELVLGWVYPGHPTPMAGTRRSPGREGDLLLADGHYAFARSMRGHRPKPPTAWSKRSGG